MANRYDKERIRENFDLVEYAKEHTKLTFRNNSWWGLCPFHNEYTASFHIHADGNFYYCQGCGAGGDSFDFVANINGLSAGSDFATVCEIMNGDKYIIDPIDKKTRKDATKKPPNPVSEAQMMSVYQSNIRYDLTKTYQYADGLIKCRYDSSAGKTFRWYWNDGNQWFHGKGDLTNGLYWSVPDGCQKPTSGIVFIAEGEKSADAVASLGYTCVTASDGGDPNAEKWRAEYTQELRGFDVYVLNDDDCAKEPNKGKLYADNVAYKIQDVAKKVVRIDINDVLKNEDNINGYDIADIVEKIGTSPTRNILDKIINEGARDTTIEVIESKINSTNDDIIAVVSRGVNDIITTGRLSFDTEEMIAGVAKKTGVLKRSITSSINELVTERKKNLSNTIVVSDGTSELITINDETWDISNSGYLCENGKIINAKTGEVVLPHICVFVANVFSVEEGTYRDMLMYNTVSRPFTYSTAVVSADEIRSTQKIVNSLAAHGIDITSEKAQYLIDFLQQMRISQGSKTHVIKEINRIGWYNDFLLPYEMEESGVVIKDKTHESATAVSYAATRGDKSISSNMINEVVNEIDIAPIVIGTMVSSLFMEKVDRKGQTHVLNISGRSGKGKSVLIKLLYSMFGNSVGDDSMFAGSDATLQSGQNTAGYLRNFPLYLDDPLQAGREDIKQTQQRIYNLVSGSGRQRLNKSGESKFQKEWFNNIIYTNESALYSADESLKGGVLSRILDVELKEEITQEKVNKWLVEIAKKNYGHFGKDFANAIRDLSSDDIVSIIQSEYDKFDEIGVDRKRGNTAACISAGYSIACKVLGLRKAFPYNTILENVQKAGEISDGARAWKVFESWLDGNIENFRSQIDIHNVVWGSLAYYRDEKIINIQTSKLRSICIDLKIPRDHMLVHCLETGLIVSEDGKITRQDHVKYGNVSVVSFYWNWNGPQNKDSFVPSQSPFED